MSSGSSCADSAVEPTRKCTSMLAMGECGVKMWFRIGRRCYLLFPPGNLSTHGVSRMVQIAGDPRHDCLAYNEVCKERRRAHSLPGDWRRATRCRVRGWVRLQRRGDLGFIGTQSPIAWNWLSLLPLRLDVMIGSLAACLGILTDRSRGPSLHRSSARRPAFVRPLRHLLACQALNRS